MHAANEILIHSSRKKIYQTVSNLLQWPLHLPHYRYVHLVDGDLPGPCVVRMGARRTGIPIKWTSRYVADPDNLELRFEHLKAFTKGMKVVWTFTETLEGTRVRIEHEMEPNLPVAGSFIAEKVIGNFFIHHVANLTLANFKRVIEGENRPAGAMKR